VDGLLSACARTCLVRVLALAGPATAAALAPSQPAAADQSAPDAARAAACAFGQALATYDYSHFQTYAAQVLDGSTGLFRLIFADNTAEIRTDLTSVHARSHAVAATCEIRTGDANRAKVGVVVDSVIALDSTRGQPQPAKVSVVLTVDNVGGRWLASAIDTPGADLSRTHR
jgi:Mce-associated membrane protein